MWEGEGGWQMHLHFSGLTTSFFIYYKAVPCFYIWFEFHRIIMIPYDDSDFEFPCLPIFGTFKLWVEIIFKLFLTFIQF